MNYCIDRRQNTLRIGHRECIDHNERQRNKNCIPEPICQSQFGRKSPKKTRFVPTYPKIASAFQLSKGLGCLIYM